MLFKNGMHPYVFMAKSSKVKINARNIIVK